MLWIYFFIHKTVLQSILLHVLHVNMFVKYNDNKLISAGWQCIVSQKCNPLPLSVLFLCSCDKVYHKLEVRFVLYLLGQIVTWYNPNLLE